MPLMEKIKECFPNAVYGQQLTQDISDFLQREYGMTQKNTLFGFSTCPDEINRTVTQFKSHYGEKQFPLGGLTGYPFRGITGFGAFSHHAPNNGSIGNLIILYGPHVGISDEGKLGKVLRENQSEESSACGASLSFLEKLKQAAIEGKGYVPKPNPLDMEQQAIEDAMLPYSKRILGSGDPIGELVNVNYEIIERDIKQIVGELEHHFKGKIAMIGGVMINTAPHNPSYFELRDFSIYANGKSESIKFDIKDAPRH